MLTFRQKNKTEKFLNGEKYMYGHQTGFCVSFHSRLPEILSPFDSAEIAVHDVLGEGNEELMVPNTLGNLLSPMLQYY